MTRTTRAVAAVATTALLLHERHNRCVTRYLQRLPPPTSHPSAKKERVQDHSVTRRRIRASADMTVVGDVKYMTHTQHKCEHLKALQHVCVHVRENAQLMGIHQSRLRSL